jgi:hypothetical protein
MDKSVLILAGSILAIAADSTLADRVGGSPKANFSTNELTIPCVKIESLSEETEGMFYDIVLARRGNSYNYELSAAEPEDAALCQRIADFAEYEDDDYAEDEEGDADNPDILVQCEVTDT